VTLGSAHQQGLVAARPFALAKGGQRGLGTGWTRGVSPCSQSNRRASLVGDGCGVISPLGRRVGGGRVAESVVGVNASRGALWAWAAEGARLGLASRQLVHP
jgi:hypothetical protein